MINVSALHQHAAAFSQRGATTLQAVHRAGKVIRRTEKQEKPTGPQKAAVTTKPRRPVMEFSTDWSTDPRYNPNNLPVGNLSHPDPVNRNRMQNFADAAQRLADHADARMEEIRAQRAQQDPAAARKARMDAALRNED